MYGQSGLVSCPRFQEDSSAHLDKWSKCVRAFQYVPSNTCLPICAFQYVRSNCTDPRHLSIVLENSSGACFAYITTMVRGQPEGMSKEVCLYAGASWQKFTCQSEMERWRGGGLGGGSSFDSRYRERMWVQTSVQTTGFYP